MKPGAFFCRARLGLTVGLTALLDSCPSKRTTLAEDDFPEVSVVPAVLGLRTGGSGRSDTSLAGPRTVRFCTGTCGRAGGARRAEGLAALGFLSGAPSSQAPAES